MWEEGVHEANIVKDRTQAWGDGKVTPNGPSLLSTSSIMKVTCMIQKMMKGGSVIG